MPTQRTINVYNFDELSDEAKQNAIAKYRRTNVDHEWYEHTIEFWKTLLGSIGIEYAEIGFSGFSSQGDGACIRSATFDPEKLAGFMAKTPKPSESCGGESQTELQAYLTHKLEYLEGFDRIWDWLAFFDVLDEFSFNLICVNSHYSHENCHRLELNGYSGNDNIDSIIDDCETELNDLRRSLCQCIYSDLEHEYDYLTSDEAVAESIEANECEFDVNGHSV